MTRGALKLINGCVDPDKNRQGREIKINHGNMTCDKDNPGNRHIINKTGTWLPGT
jgi:hypothetical protein